MQYYYDLTWTPDGDGTYSQDSESQLVALCVVCAAQAGRLVTWAGACDDDMSCDGCGGWEDTDG